jgi:hypothetical protein
MRSHILIPLFGVAFLIFPLAAHAAIPFFGPIIPAAQASCPAGWALVMTVINNIISLLITLLIVFIAPLTIAWAGFLYVVNPVDPSGKSKAKSILIHTVVGLVVALAGWLIVDFVMAVLYNKDSTGKTWSTLVTGGGDTCIKIATQFNPATPPVGTPSGTGTTTPGVTPAAGFDPVVAARTLAFSVSATQSGGACAYSVRTNALIPGGLSSFSSSYPNAAADYGSYLIKAGFQTVSSSNYQPMIGDIVVFDRSAGHNFGHIEMYTTSGWISDFIQKTMYPWTGGSYTIYRWPQAGPGGGGSGGGSTYTPTEQTEYQIATLHNPHASFPVFQAVMGTSYAFPIPREHSTLDRTFTSGFIQSTMATGNPGQQMPTQVEWAISPYPGDFGYGKTEEAAVSFFGTKQYPCNQQSGIESGGIRWVSPDQVNNINPGCIVPADASWYINFRVTEGCDIGVVCPLIYAWIPGS